MSRNFGVQRFKRHPYQPVPVHVQVADFLQDHPWLFKSAVVVVILMGLAIAARADTCTSDNSGHTFCGAAYSGVRTAARRAHRSPRERAAARPALDANGVPAAPTVVTEIDEEAAAWRKPIAVVEGHIRSRKTGATASISPKYQAQFQALADDLEDYSPESKIYYMGGWRDGNCAEGKNFHRCMLGHQHFFKLAIDFCQDSRGRISGARDCHLPPPDEFHRLVRKHHLFDGSVWCDGDYGHVQALNSGGCTKTAHGIAAGVLYTITGKVVQVARAVSHHRAHPRHYAQRDYSARRRYAHHHHRHHRIARM